MRRPLSRAAWDDYLRQFHHDRPGITEAVLRRCRSAGQTPYEWLVDAAALDATTVIDVACGSAPTRGQLGPKWLGVDSSFAELAAAGPDSAGRAVQGDLGRLPVRSDVCDTIICSMALMLVDPLDEALRELHRVLHAGGSLRLLLPVQRPMTIGDQLRYALLAAALGTASLFPPSPLLRRPEVALAEAGYRVIEDASRRFSYPLRCGEDASVFVDSLYLPGVTAGRRHVAARLAASWSPGELGVPLRRVVVLRVGN